MSAESYLTRIENVIVIRAFETVMNRCPLRPLRGLALPNVHEKQGLKIKYFSEFFKNFVETEGVLI